MNKLQLPEYYHQQLTDLRREKEYAKRWKVKLEVYTNRYPNYDGSPWGWYEVYPLGESISYWSGWNKEKDDLKGVDIAVFNAALAELDKETK